MQIYIFQANKRSFTDAVRFASKKTGGSTKNSSPKVHPKHRGWKKQDYHFVHAGHTLATQNKLRFLPGLNVLKLVAPKFQNSNVYFSGWVWKKWEPLCSDSWASFYNL